MNSVSLFTRSSKLSNRTSPCDKPYIRGIRLPRLSRKSRASDYFNWRNDSLLNIVGKREVLRYLRVARYSLVYPACCSAAAKFWPDRDTSKARCIYCSDNRKGNPLQS